MMVAGTGYEAGAAGPESPSDRTRSGQPRSDQPRSDQPWADQPRSEQPRSDQPWADQPRADQIEIVDLRDRPDHLDAVVAMVWREWRDLVNETLAAARRAWQSDLQGSDMPVHLAALDRDGRCLGTASLAREDLPLRPDLTPWLTAVLVRPACRGRGIGRRLVAGAERLARDRFGHDRLHLFTTGASAYYRGMGWRSLGLDRFHGRPVTIMVRKLA